jgi:hypothetical protein
MAQRQVNAIQFGFLSQAEFLQLLDVAARLQVYLASGPAAKIVPYSRPRGSRKP